MCFVKDPFSVLNITVCVNESTPSVRFALLPVALVYRSIWPSQLTTAIQVAFIVPLTFIRSTSIKLGSLHYSMFILHFWFWIIIERSKFLTDLFDNCFVLDRFVFHFFTHLCHRFLPSKSRTLLGRDCSNSGKVEVSMPQEVD